MCVWLIKSRCWVTEARMRLKEWRAFPWTNHYFRLTINRGLVKAPLCRT